MQKIHSVFKIRKENIPSVCMALGSGKKDKGTSVDTLFNIAGYSLIYDPDKNIDSLILLTDKPNVEIFYLIAPFVEEDCFVAFIDDDYNLFRFYFKNGQCIRQTGRTIWQ